jgi:hypothetical protein
MEIASNLTCSNMRLGTHLARGVDFIPGLVIQRYGTGVPPLVNRPEQIASHPHLLHGLQDYTHCTCCRVSMTWRLKYQEVQGDKPQATATD